MSPGDWAVLFELSLSLASPSPGGSVLACSVQSLRFNEVFSSNLPFTKKRETK